MNITLLLRYFFIYCRGGGVWNLTPNTSQHNKRGTTVLTDSILIFSQMKTRYGGYAPCGSALVITLLQKYRFPLSPSNTTPETDTHSVYTHPQ